MESLADLPANTSVFIDANIFIYHFCKGEEQFSEQSSNLLLRIEHREIRAFTSTFILSEVLHRAMIYEAIEKTGLDPKGTMNKLRRNVSLVKSLTQYSNISDVVNKIGVRILPLSFIDFSTSASLRTKYGLMVNDSLVLSIMSRHGIFNLATNDADFDNISEITVWKPIL